MLRFYNTMTRKVEDFIPLEEGKVKMYTCGPTVYDFAHIGNLRTFIFEDILRRHLEYSGFEVNHVKNITDVDDKTIRDSKAAGLSLQDFTRKYEKAFFEDCDTLNLLKAHRYPRATEHIDDMVEFIKQIKANNHTYDSKGSVYFRIKSLPEYGRLSGVDLSEVIDGASVDADEYEKEDVKDFVLWKGKKEGEPYWDTDLGPGRPGWHIECSVLGMKYLGDIFDIHSGGVDLIFPHHENELAQARAVTGKDFVRYWLHASHLIVEGEKMSKSKGNFFTLRDIIDKGYRPQAIRYLLMSVHYRKSLNFTFEGLNGSEETVKRLEDFIHTLSTSRFEEGPDPDTIAAADRAKEEFKKAMDEDLNISGALGCLFQLVRTINAQITAGKVSREGADYVLQTLLDTDRVLGIMGECFSGAEAVTLTLSDNSEIKVFPNFKVPDNILDKIKRRQEARKSKDFAASDAIRDELNREGYTLEDFPDGVSIKKR